MPTDAPASRLARISLTKLRAHPRNVRMDLGDLTELAESIRAEGLHQPIQVQPLGGGYFVIVDGHRRFGACVLAGLRTADVLIGPVRTTAQIVTTMLTTGVHAKPLTLAERQRALRILLDDERLPVSEVAAQLGVTAATIRRWRDGDPTRERHAAADKPPGDAPASRPPRGRGRPPSNVGVRRITALAERWTERVDECGLTFGEAQLLLAELRALTTPAEPRTESQP
jgi:ParB/RepB/Spo0J family partition protein